MTQDINYVMAVSCDARFTTPTGPRRADELAASAPKSGWQRLSLRRREQGPATLRLAAHRPRRRCTHLLLVRRSITKPSELAYYICRIQRPGAARRAGPGRRVPMGCGGDLPVRQERDRS